MPPNTSAIVATVMSILRSIAVVVAAVPPILALMSRHDIAGLVAYVQTDALVPAITAVVAFGLAGYGAFLRWRGHRAEKVVKAVAPPVQP